MSYAPIFPIVQLHLKRKKRSKKEFNVRLGDFGGGGKNEDLHALSAGR